MKGGERKLYKGGLLAAALLLLLAVGQIQHVLNRQRTEFGLTRLPPLENAPPVLALTTQALGGFRGLIANALWIRANQLQLEDKFFEMVQLADWITKLEPHFVQVWLFQSWNMAFNISVKFHDPSDRWRWVQRGIELLRDDGLRFNPNEPLIYRELAWFFQFKMGQNMDDAHLFYKRQWALEMTDLFGSGRPDFGKLLQPETDAEKSRAALLRKQYKMDPAVIRAVDERHGPLDWRLPETHAIYWATLGLENSKPEQLITLRRVIYQSMHLAFQRGTLYLESNAPPRFAPNLEIVGKANSAYEQMIEEDAEMREAIKRAHRNFLREAVYQLYIHNRISAGEQWLKHLRSKYPDAVPANTSLAEYAVMRVTEDASDRGQNRIASLVQALILQSYLSLIEDQPDDASQYALRAQEIWQSYHKRTGDSQRLSIATVPEIKQRVLNELLGPSTPLTPDAVNRLRTVLGLPAGSNVSPSPNR